MKSTQISRRLALGLTFALIGLSGVGEGISQEIGRGFVLPVTFGQGFRSSSNMDAELYLATVRTQPSITLPGNKVRLGLTGLGTYANPGVDVVLGPAAALRLYTKNTDFGTLFNVQLTAEALWGTSATKLWSGGFLVELNPVLFSFRFFREYEHRENWLEAGIGVNLDTFFHRHDDDGFAEN